MKHIIALITLGIIINSSLNAQDRVIKGRVISEHLDIIYAVKIQSVDSATLGETDINGKFEIDLPANSTQLLLRFIGMESMLINIPINCDNLEAVMMYEAIYDFIAIRKIDRLRKKRFENLSKVHKKAFEKGIFVNEEVCFSSDFIPYREKKRNK